MFDFLILSVADTRRRRWIYLCGRVDSRLGLVSNFSTFILSKILNE
jgi:hypothetical protein